MSGEGSPRRKSWLKAGLGIGRASGAGAAAVVAGRFVCAGFDLDGVLKLGLCGDTAAAGAVVENGCDSEGLLLEIDLKALVPGLMAAFIAMLCSLKAS